MSEEKSIEVIPRKLYVGCFKGCRNGGPLRRYISISDDPEPGLGEWMTLAEAKKLVAALQKCLKQALE